MLRPRSSSKKRQTIPAHYHVKRGDMVMIIAGKDKGKSGVVLRVFRNRGKVLVEGVNLIKKAVRPNPVQGQRGGIVEMEAPFNVSNVMLYDTKANQPSRVRIETRDARRVRVLIKSGEVLE